ncbi:MAG: DNA topoisomerase (ATP-hydrolyzing) subunit B [Dehalococcoidia bacterium]
MSSLEQNRNNQYTAEDIEVLSGLEAVRRRPGMYIGSTGQRGLHHLVQEIVYNSVDEAMAGCCDRVEVTIFKDGRVEVADNGRGIPIDIHPVTSTPALEAVMTMLHAGAKFGGRGYKVSGGLHGVGASVVNALSSWLKVEVKREGKLFCQEYCRGVAQNAVEEVGEASDTGTITTFLADKEIFGSLNYDFDALAQRFREMCYLTKGLELHFEDQRTNQGTTFYFEGGIASFARYLNKNRPVLHKPIYISKMVNSTEVEAALQYNEGFTETTFSFANCINTLDGGSHLTGFRTALTRVINDCARKLKLLKEDDANLIGDDTREGLVAIISVKLAEPQFEGQTKAKLGNPEIKSHVESAVVEGLSQYLEEHPPEAKRIIEKCLTAAKAREAARKARDLVIRKSAFESTTLPGKLTDCSEKDPSRCELYLVEGPSAGGSAKEGRDRRFQAILPLRGKVLNVEKAPPDKMLAHEEIRTIITALGAGIDNQMELSRLRYHRIIIMTDADVDGSHIRTLLLTFFFRHMAELINNGHLYIAQPPLYRINSGKEEHWVYSEKEKEELVKKLKGSKKLEIQRYKGLGEMSAQQLWETTMNPETRTILRVNVADAVKADQIFRTLMGDEVPPRKAFIQAHAKSVRNLDI